MSIMSRVASCSIATIAALLLAACGDQSTSTTAPVSAPASAAATSATTAPSRLKITSWGPHSTKAGEAFNKQPDGSAALWIRLNQSLDGDVAAVEFNGVLLQGNISGNLVTTGVPADLYAKPGVYTMHVLARKGERTTQTNDVKFTVD